MQYNVSEILKHYVGESRVYPIKGTVSEVDEAGPANVEGRVELIRTLDGILARVETDLTVEDECSRCLNPVRTPLHVQFEEEYFPTVDVLTGGALPAPAEPDPFLIDRNHILDLEDAIREYTLAIKPMQPLCRGDCKGICPTCGTDLNTGACECREPEIDPRWAALGRLLQQE